MKPVEQWTNEELLTAALDDAQYRTKGAAFAAVEQEILRRMRGSHLIRSREEGK